MKRKKSNDVRANANNGYNGDNAQSYKSSSIDGKHYLFAIFCHYESNLYISLIIFMSLG